MTSRKISRVLTYVNRHRVRYQGIIDQGVWAIGGQFLTAVFGLAGNRLITEYVDPRVFGLVTLFQNAALLLRALFCAPFFGAALRFYADAERGNYLAALRRLLTHKLVLAVLAMEVVAIAGGIFWAARLDVPAYIVAAIALYAAADVARTLHLTLFSAAGRQRPYAIVSAVEALLRPLLVVGGAILLGASAFVVMGAMALSIMIVLVGIYACLGRPSGGGENPIPADLLKGMTRFAIPLLPIALLNWVTSSSDRYIIEWLTHDSASVGVYAAGYGLISQPLNMLQGIIVMVLRPVYFSAAARDEEGRAERTFRFWLIGSAGACLLLALVITLGREFIIDTFLGARYRGAVAMVPWIALGYVFYAIEQVFEQKLLARRRSGAVLVAQVFGAAASIGVTIPLVLRFGMIGAAYACPVYFLIQCAAAALFIKRR